MSSIPHRYVPDAPFPPYSYVTGRYPHPLSDPTGHSFGKQPEAVTPGDLDSWRTCRLYLLGIDLFNHGYYWEAHETWEALWHAAGRRGPIADFLKGLIKLAAAGVKAREGRVEGVRRHAVRSNALFQQTIDSGRQHCMGLPLHGLVTTTARMVEEYGRYNAIGDESVKIVFDFRLRLASPE